MWSGGYLPQLRHLIKEHCSAGLSLTRVASGTSSTDPSVTWVSYATLNAVAAAVNALGNG